MAPSKRVARCLDFGCGGGWLAQQAAAEFGVRAFGYDPSHEMIAQARRYKSQASFSASLEEAEAAGPFDLVFAVFVTPALSTKAALEQLFADTAPMLRRNGRLFIAAANPDGVFARHAHFESRAPANKRAGATYQTDILGPGGVVLLTVTDHFWPATTIVGAAAKAQLRLTADSLIADSGSELDAHRFPYRIWEFISAG